MWYNILYLTQYVVFCRKTEVIMALFDTTSFRIAEQGLDLLVKQQQIIAQNIANVDTPDYKAKYLYFAGVLKETIDEKTAEKK